MEVFKSMREPSLAKVEGVDSFLQIADDGKLISSKETKLERKIYIFDQIQVLRLLTSIILRKNSITGLILKHNDSKTIKFIFRNIYPMLAL